jgi:large subunit ribosomal protein L25
VQERESRGTREARRLRKQGLVPGVLYGQKLDPVPICVPERELRRALTGSHGLHAILDVVVGEKKKVHPAILKAHQAHPVRGQVLHVDLQEVRLDQPIQSAVTIELVGDSTGVREGGVLQQALRDVSVEALPMEMPDSIVFDISELGVGDSVRVGDLTAPEGATILDDPDTVVASVTTPTQVVEPEEVLEAEEAEAVERPPAEQAPEGAAEQQSDAGAEDAAGSQGTVPG